MFFNPVQMGSFPLFVRETGFITTMRSIRYFTLAGRFHPQPINIPAGDTGKVSYLQGTR